MSDLLSRLFPPDGPRRTNDMTGGTHFITHPEDIQGTGKSVTTDISTRWRTVLSLEIQGLDKSQIAEMMQLSPATVGAITRDERYIEYRDKYLSTEFDKEFLAMKPLAFAALKGGLSSNDENTALRASEQWFKGAGFGGFSRHEKPPDNVSAEDVARQLLSISASGPVQVNIVHNHNKTGREDDGE